MSPGLYSLTYRLSPIAYSLINLQMDKRCKWFFFFFSFFFLSSCASAPPQKKESPFPALQMKEIESSRQVKAMKEKLLMSTLAGRKTSQRDYKIGPEDLVEISVFEEEKLNKTARVSSQGNISLPLLGILRVRGLTSNEL